MKQPDPFDLQRFVTAQASVYASVLAELRGGRKRTHWMWYIFPQIAGLGYSAMSERYAIASADEAATYLAHPVLGVRLRECVQTVLAVENRSASDIFGYPDDLKLQSSLTLFSHVAAATAQPTEASDRAATTSADPANAVFAHALDKYFGGKRDAETLRRLAAP